MKNINIIIGQLIVMLLIMSSCGTSFHLSKGTKLYSKKSGALNDQIQTDVVDSGTAVEIVEKDKHYIIKPIHGSSISVNSGDATSTDVKTASQKVEDDFRRSISDDTYYYPDKDASKSSFTYSSWNSSLKAISVSFKNRSNFRGPNQEAMAVRDSFPSSWNSGFSPALAYGISRSWNVVNQSKKKTTFELSMSFFYGLGITDINNKTTRYPIIQTSSKALYNSKGFLINIGIQKFDFGYAIGWDHAFGSDNDAWAYHGQKFTGFVLGYDLFKTRE